MTDPEITLFGSKILTALPHLHHSQQVDKDKDKESSICNTVSEWDADADADTNSDMVEQPKAPKKPEKILPCPRCNSLDTKFCYFNNYNTNQPRHFCKACHRYWTAGGLMRNVPVGAGRRKNKNSASHCRHNHIAVSQLHHHGSTNSSTPNQVQHTINIPFPAPPWQLPVVPLYPIPFYPAAPCNWNFPWLSIPSPVTDQNLGPASPHARNGKKEWKDSKSSTIVVPKTLRIDDPEEAAKSSIWKTLGIEYDSSTREGLFKALQSKGDDKKCDVPSPVLQANPAAMSRSISFHERS